MQFIEKNSFNVRSAVYHLKKVIGVVYGAMHMRNVIRFLLSGLNYRVAGAEWVTVFDL